MTWYSIIMLMCIYSFMFSKPDSPNGFWELSEQIFNRISDKRQVKYSLANCDVAMRQNILFYSIVFLFFIAYWIFLAYIDIFFIFFHKIEIIFLFFY